MASRIPVPAHLTVSGVTEWFEILAQDGLIFHPEDDPASIVEVKSGRQFFTEEEVTELRVHIASIADAIGDDSLMECVYRPFMIAAGHDPASL